jgi:Acetyltransferase (GNAT) domain
VTTATADLFVGGTWIKVPALDIDGRTVLATGRWLRMAALEGEDCLDRELENPGRCIQRLKDRRSHGLNADIFTFAQTVSTPEPRYRYPMQRDSIATIRLTSFKDWWEDLPQEGRKNVRRAAKRGVVVESRALDDALIRQIMDLNNETPSRQGRRFTHYGESFEEVKRDFSSFADRGEFVCAFLGEELIGIVKIVYCGNIGVIMKLQPKTSHYDKRPANAILAKAVECCEHKGVSYITYGKYRYGNQERTSLMEFKARHGFQEVLVPRYLVPLTVKGQLAVRLGLHRKLVEIVPERVLRVARDARRRWHSSFLAGVAQR